MRLTEAQRELASLYVPLAKKLARRFAEKRPYLADEIHSAAQLGLTLAAESYDDSLQVTFATYARKLIRNAILREIRDSGPRGFRRSRADRPQIHSLGPSVERLAARPGGPTVEEQAQAAEGFERLLSYFRPGHRPLLRLLFAEDLSIGEAAGELGLTRAEALALYSHALTGLGTRTRPQPPPRVLIVAAPVRRRRLAAY
jgi:RNA polymerase sigma factor (sigma-70 family)